MKKLVWFLALASIAIFLIPGSATAWQGRMAGMGSALVLPAMRVGCVGLRCCEASSGSTVVVDALQPMSK